MNDLIGLEYAWGHRPSDGTGKTDCFQLSCEVRKLLGMFSFANTYQWVYDQYTEDSLPNRQLMRFLLESGKRIEVPTVGAMALFSGEKAALGTVTDYGIVFIAPGGRVVHAPVFNATYYFKMNK
jgi:hypothetical protein